jgi:enoyl-CoA hydratase/carnithine racemase
LDYARLPDPVVIDRSGDMLSFTLNNADAGNEVTAPMFDAMIAALRSARAAKCSARDASALARTRCPFIVKYRG